MSQSDFKGAVRRALMATANTTAAKTVVEDEHGLDSGDAAIAVEDVAAEMVFAAPAEIRASFATVVSWHRWNQIVDMAMSQGATDRAMEAQKHLDDIIKGVH